MKAVWEVRLDVIVKPHSKALERSMARPAVLYPGGHIPTVLHAALVRLVQAARILRDRCSNHADYDWLACMQRREEMVERLRTAELRDATLERSLRQYPNISIACLGGVRSVHRLCVRASATQFSLVAAYLPQGGGGRTYQRKSLVNF